MTVTAILKQKGSSAVSTVSPDATMADVVRLLAHHRIGALVVSSDGARVEGIISERDVVRVLAENGPAGMARPVGGVMTTGVECCTAADRALDIIQRMTNGRFRHMPVVKDGKLTALISIGDVVKYRIAEIEMEKTALEDMVKGF